jgi:hypothetical protein
MFADEAWKFLVLFWMKDFWMMEEGKWGVFLVRVEKLLARRGILAWYWDG